MGVIPGRAAVTGVCGNEVNRKAGDKATLADSVCNAAAGYLPGLPPSTAIMKKKASLNTPAIFDRVQVILDSAQSHAARSVNTTQVVANWLVGREIVEEQQQGAKRAGYGTDVIAKLAADLKSDGATGYGV